MVVRRAYRANRAAQGTMSYVLVDGAPVFQNSEQAVLARPLATLYDHEASPGPHHVRVVERVEGMFRFRRGWADLPLSLGV
ncbi:MAG TPA: hypothetical protein VGM29_06400, partial [Polyangiaceae bacterium]